MNALRQRNNYYHRRELTDDLLDIAPVTVVTISTQPSRPTISIVIKQTLRPQPADHGINICFHDNLRYQRRLRFFTSHGNEYQHGGLLVFHKVNQDYDIIMSPDSSKNTLTQDSQKLHYMFNKNGKFLSLKISDFL